MKKYYSANGVVVGIMTLFILSAILFLSRDKFLLQEEKVLVDYNTYLLDKLEIINKLQDDPESQCELHQSANIYHKVGRIIYSFQCEPTSIFWNMDKLPTKSHLYYSEIDKILNLTPYLDEIYHINSLAELPNSSESEPKIVIVDKEINERLTQDFYGIIITKHRFQFTQHKIYGLFISPYQDDAEYINIKRRSSVLDRLNQQFIRWKFIPYTRNILNDRIP